MISRIAPNIILSIIWLLVSESRIIIGTFFLVSIIFLIVVDTSKFAQKLLYFLGILAFIPILYSNNIFSQIILLVVINTYIYFYSKSEQVSFNIGAYAVTAISYVFFNYLYSFAGKTLSLISYLGFDNTGHLGLLFAITKKGNYLNPFTESGTDLGLTFWKYYPQGVVGSISTLIRTLGLDQIDQNKYSFYLIYMMFNILIYLIIFYLFYLICKSKLKKFNVIQSIFTSSIIILLFLYSFLGIFLVHGFINYTYSIVLLEIYILGLINKKSFNSKILILSLILFTSPFIFPIFIASEFFNLVIKLKSNLLFKRNLYQFCLMFLICCSYLFYFRKNWGLEYLSTPGFIPNIPLREFILIPIFIIIYVYGTYFKTNKIEEFEIVTMSSIVIFAALSGVTLIQRENVSYYATKQGYIALILTLFNLIYYMYRVTKSSKIFALALLIVIGFTSRSDISIFNKIKFFNTYGENSPWIIVNGQSLATATALVQLMDYNEYVYVGYYDSDLSSRILNGSISNWNDLNSGLFFGLQGNANLVNIENQINGLSDLARRLKVPELSIDRTKMLVFYEKNTSISKELNKDMLGFNLYFIN